MGIDKKNGRITRSKSAKHGPKKDVEQRKPKQRGPERGSPPARSNVDAIVYSTFEQAHSDLGSDKIAQRARKEVERGTVDATVNRSNDTIRWGNSKGLSALEEIENMKKQVKFLQEFRTSALVTMNTSDASNAKLTADVQALKLSTDSFLTVRSRCFAIFLRDKIQRCSRTDAKVIKDGNVAAHEGDPLVDAMMYKKGVRSDHRTFTLLYGMPWQQVLDYVDTKDVIHLLSVHATALINSPDPIGEDGSFLKGDDRETPLGQVEAAFAKFIDAVQQAGYRKDFLKDSEAAETRAYWEFWNKYYAYKKSVGMDQS